MIPYESEEHAPVALPPRQKKGDYREPARPSPRGAVAVLTRAQDGISPSWPPLANRTKSRTCTPRD